MLPIIKSHLITASLGKATPIEEDHDRQARILPHGCMDIQEEAIFLTWHGLILKVSSMGVMILLYAHQLLFTFLHLPRSVVGFYQSGFLLPGDGSHYDGLLGALDSIVWKSIIIFTISSLSGGEFHWNATVCPPEVDIPEICMHGLGIWLAIRGVVQESLYTSGVIKSTHLQIPKVHLIPGYLMVSHLHVLWKILNMLQFYFMFLQFDIQIAYIESFHVLYI